MSPDGRLLAYSVDTTGGERFTLRVRDLATGGRLPDVDRGHRLRRRLGRQSHLFYTRADEAWRPYVVLRHRLGTDPADDAEVLTEPDERFWVGVDTSRDDRWVVIGMGSKLTSEYHLLPADQPEGAPRLVAPRREGVEYDVEPAGDRLLIVHNDGAPRTSSWPRRRWTPPAPSSGRRCSRTSPASGCWASAPTPGTPSSRCAATG